MDMVTAPHVHAHNHATNRAHADQFGPNCFHTTMRTTVLLNSYIPARALTWHTSHPCTLHRLHRGDIESVM